MRFSRFEFVSSLTDRFIIVECFILLARSLAAGTLNLLATSIATMDRDTFEALHRIMVHVSSTNLSNGLHDDLDLVFSWMSEMEEEIEDVETLGSDSRPPLSPVA